MHIRACGKYRYDFICVRPAMWPGVWPMAPWDVDARPIVQRPQASRSVGSARCKRYRTRSDTGWITDED